MIEHHRRKFNGLFKAVHDVIFDVFRHQQRVTVVSIVSINDHEQGQWIIGDPNQDRLSVAKRLRICADILEKQ